jgi:hypothetical protein
MTLLRRTTAVAAAGVLVALSVPASAAHGGLTVTGLTVSDRLVTFLANDPGTVLSEVKVTGVRGDLASIDFRPATGELYGVGVTGKRGTVYTIDTTTGAATPVPGAPVLPVDGVVSIDWNPRADALRIVDSSGSNLRLPFTGAAAGPLFEDARLSYVDANAGTAPVIGAIAYTDNEAAPAAPAPATRMFDLDTALGQLVRQNPPNAGTLTAVGALPQASELAFTGFDVYQREIARGGQNWAFVSLFEQGRTTFYEIDLATGAARTFAANPADPASGTVIGSTPHVTDIALEPRQGV